jgi:hypothetical protein
MRNDLVQRQNLPEPTPTNSDSKRMQSETIVLLSRLLSAFPERNADEATGVDRLRGYTVAVERFPVVVLREAAHRLLRGEIDTIDPRFMPTPPQLARLCNAILAENYPMQPHPMRLEKFDAPANPEMVKRLAALVQSLAAEADAQRAVHWSEGQAKVADWHAKRRAG